MFRTHLPTPALRRLGRLVAMVVALVATACGDASDPATSSEGPKPPIPVLFALSFPAVPGITPARAHAIVHDAAGGVVADTVASLAASTSSLSGVGPQRAADTQVTFTILLPGALEGETVTVSVEVLDQGGAIVFSGYDQALQDLGSRSAATLLEVFYAGPGAGATSVELVATDNPVAPGDLVTVTAVVRDGAGTELFDVPVSWTVTGAALTLEKIESVAGRAVASVRAGAEEGVGSLIALLPTDVQGATDLQVAIPVGDVPVTVSVADIPGMEQPTLRLSLRRTGGEVLADTSVALDTQGGPPWTARFDLPVPLAQPDEVFLADAEVVDEAGAAWLTTAAPVATPTGTEPTEVPLVYVGPGADVSSIRLTVESSPTPPGSTVVVSAILKDDAGAEVLDVPVVWSVSGASMAVTDVAVVNGRSVASVRVGDAASSGSVTVRLPSGQEARTLIVVERPPRPLSLSFTIPEFPGLDLTNLDITVQEADGSPVASRLVTLPLSGPVEFLIPAAFDGSSFLVTAEARNEEGTLFYGTSSPVTATANQANAVALAYLGPGSEASSVSIDVTGTPARDGDVVTATAIVEDGEGDEIPDVPVSWTAAPGTLAVVDVSWVDGRSQARVKVGTSSGAIRATIPTGTYGEGTVEVESGPAIVWKNITKSYPTIPGVDLALLTLKVWRGDGTLALDSVAPWSTSVIPLLADSATEPFTIQAAAYDSDERLWLDMDAPVDMAPSFYPTELSLEYVGPGADAETVSVTPQTETIQAGSRLVLEARAYDGGGNYISGVPMRWTTGAGLQIDSVWLDPTARYSKAAVTALAEGAVQVTATTVSGIEGTASVTVEGLPPLDAAIDFEYFPDGTRTCVKCSISTQFSSVGVTFRFYGAFASGGAGYPTTVRDSNGNTRLTNDYQRFAYGGYLTGIIKMSFARAIPQASFTMTAPGISTDTFIVYDTQGQVIDDAVVDVQPISQAGAWVTAVVTISSPGGIGVIDAKATGSIVYIDDLVF